MLPVRIRIDSGNTTHIHVKKSREREDTIRAMMFKAQATILVASIILLGAFSMVAIVRLHQVEQQLAASARV